MDTKTVSRVWWAIAVRGALAVLFGVVALFYTGRTLLALVYVFGVFAVLIGIMAIVAAVRAGESHLRWGWLAFSGIVGVAAGIVSFVWPGITALTVVFLVAVWAIIGGVAEIAFALQWPDNLAHPWLAGISGALSVVFGVLLAVWPRSGAVALTWLLGIYAILYGATLLYYAYRLQVLRGEVHSLTDRDRRAPA
ncbi:MAG TPA: HdeD family acid-resistance protein [Ktedonobacterales bacterium]